MVLFFLCDNNMLSIKLDNIDSLYLHINRVSNKIKKDIKKPDINIRFFCGREGIRTPDPLGVNQVL